MSAKQRRQGTRMCVDRELKKALDLIEASDDKSLANLQVSVEKLTKYLADLQKYDNEVIAELKDDGEIEKEVETCADLSDQMLEVIARANVAVKSAAKAESGQEKEVAKEDSGKKGARMKLPKLQIAQFGGEPLEWQGFWDAFESSIHKNPSLTDIDKFNYLKGLLTGEALRVVEGYRLTAANYESVVAALQERFGNNQLAIFAHFEAMLAIPQANHDIAQLQSVADTCEKHIRSLVALGLEEKTFEQVFTPIMLAKLPKYVKIELHRRNGSQVWSLSHLREWLKDEIRARDLGQRDFGNSQSKYGDDTSTKTSKTSKDGNSSGKGKKPVTSVSSLVSNVDKASTVKCTYCSESHHSDTCPKFPTVESRSSQLSDRCFNCLRSGHSAKQCRKKIPCFHCKREGHHRSLCYKKFGKDSGAKKAAKPEVSTSLNVSAKPFEPTTVAVSSAQRTILQTALATISNVAGTAGSKARLLFDTAASRSFITEAKRAELQLPCVGEESVSVSGFRSNRRRTSTFKMVEFLVRCLDGSTLLVQASVVPTITCPIQKIPIDADKFPIVKSLPLSEPIISRPEFVGIDVLVGNDQYYDFVSTDRIQCQGGPLFLSSRLGFIATGRVQTDITGADTIAVMLLHHGPTAVPQPNSDFSVERFWDIEEIGIGGPEKDSSYDEEALSKFNSSIRFRDGRYEARWPWKDERVELCDNFPVAYGRLNSLKRRFANDEKIMQAYGDSIADQLNKGIIEVAPDVPSGDVVYYMPHHCVVTPSRSTTKVRVVYDASSKPRDDLLSLNECLFKGPLFLEDLCGLILRFRLHRVAMISDIEKAFLQVGLQECDRDSTRFLWLKDFRMPAKGDNLVTFRFCRIPFGVISSPFVLAATILHHLEHSDSKVAQEVKDNIYVDNVLAGKDSPAEAIDYYKETKSLFRSASMNLREWYTNDPTVRPVFAPTDVGKDQVPKLLGLSWDTTRDSLSCSGFHADQAPCTKRTILRSVAKFYDPCGFFAPVTVKGKMLVQDLWKLGCSWDDRLDESWSRRWEKLLSDLEVSSVSGVPRCIGGSTYTDLQLHAFCDASEKAYGCAVYLRKGGQSTVSCDLLLSKSRLAPLRQELKIPRLELVAVTVGVRVLSFVEKQLKITIHRKCLWTDSQCTLGWIQHKKVYTRFVENRLAEIRKHSDTEFKYVPSVENPADLLSRGCDASFLQISSLWWKGPPWLQCDPIEWPTFSLGGESDVTMELVAASSVLTVPRTVINMEDYSCLSKLLRITALVFRFVSNCRSSASERKYGNVNTRELQGAELYWQKSVQVRGFPELARFEGTTWPKGLGSQLNLFRDSEGILRCAGRIDHSAVPYNAKYPILLPSDGHFTMLVIQCCHENLLHAGVAQTLAKVREKYWITRGRRSVRRMIRMCKRCRKVEGGSYRVPDFPVLPPSRLSDEEPAFTNTGVDYLGPLWIRTKDGTKEKVWICLFVCMVVRAIHLEVISDLSTSEFLLALRRFVAHYGTPKLIVSDNATNFRQASRILDKLWTSVIKSDSIEQYSADRGIRWEFIVEHAPWMGGFYERLVGIVKSALKKVLNTATVNVVELRTIAAEICSVVNSRPLTYVENEVGTVPLTPASLLSNARARSMPEFSENKEWEPTPSSASVLISKWKRLQSITTEFWRMWRNQYLLSLRERTARHKQRNCSELGPQVGSVVQIKETSAPRSCWKLGKVHELNKSRDGKVRSAVVKTANGKLLCRSLGHLYPLELGKETQSTPCAPKEKQSVSRPQRVAADKARERCRTQLKDEESTDDE